MRTFARFFFFFFTAGFLVEFGFTVAFADAFALGEPELLDVAFVVAFAVAFTVGLELAFAVTFAVAVGVGFLVAALAVGAAKESAKMRRRLTGLSKPYRLSDWFSRDPT
jgi:hypothetical protein